MRKKLFVGRRIELEHGESIDSALRRLRVSLCYETGAWHKARRGYHEPPSALRRKARKMAGLRGLGLRVHLYLDLAALHDRTGPTHAAGR